MPGASLSNDAIAAPVAIPLEETYYKVRATNVKGCVATDSVLIKVNPVQEIFIPTAFTPNGDGKNDHLIPFFPATTVLKNFTVYNRWGQLVFSSDARGKGWNGKLSGVEQAPGVYIWVFKASDGTGKQLERKGTVLLSR
jgi:gliding motility-associated-like protein